MAEIVNLGRARKARVRKEQRAAADANAAKFSRTLAERSHAAAEAEKAARDLDGHRREAPDPDA